jgi:23S rRNA pseudouridine1911/1915/1917 synthase
LLIADLTMSSNTRTFTVSETDAGMRLDKFLAAMMPEFSRSEIQKFTVVCRLSSVKFSQKIKTGETYEIEIPEKNNVIQLTTDDRRQTTDLQILFEDPDIIVVNKPRGVVMYPAAGNHDGTLVQNILAHTSLSTLGGGLRPGVVHRLDKDTSGVVVLAKSDAAYRALVKMFAEHNLARKYIAFVWGVPNWESADITGNIARSTRNRQKMSMVKTGGKEAHTEVEVMQIWGRANISQIRCTLHTGRTHQIRVHLSSHGFPVLCDPVYGRGATRLGSVKNPELLEFLRGRDGQMLHAAVLEFAHPITGAALKFKTKLPGDMAELKEILDSSF